VKILLLAPHPFYQERGTPIAVNLLLGVLSEQGHSVDVLTYHVGENVTHPNVTIHRIRSLGFIKAVRPGFSLRKLVCDAFLYAKALRMARADNYDLVHAVEESVFIARAIRRRFGIPYIYDMDSSMPQQMVEKIPILVLLLPVMRWFERRAIRSSAAVATICDSLAGIARDAGAAKVVILNDISLLETAPAGTGAEVRKNLGITGFCFMYVGNLEHYQGVDLLLESFAILRKSATDSALVIAGGTGRDVAKYGRIAAGLGIDKAVHFLGPWPVKQMASLFEAADVLVSPRIKGSNTPMKIYSYLHSGKPVLATDMPAHTQVLDAGTAELALPDPTSFSTAMLRLAQNADLRARLGTNGRELAEKKYCLDAFKRSTVELYSGLTTKPGT